MKWKPIDTVGAEEFIIVAIIAGASIEQLTWIDDGFPYGDGGGREHWTHWCEQPEMPHPAESWPVDAKVIVSFSPDFSKSYNLHFKEYKNGRFYVFDNGRSSWTISNVHAVSSYAYARLAEDGE